MSARKLSYPLKYEHSLKVPDSLSSRRLGENGSARERHTGGEEGRGSSFSPRVSLSRAPVLSCAHYFQAPARQARSLIQRQALDL